MCDYSRYMVQNRLPEGEELVLHRLPTGTLGFVSCSDLEAQEAAARTHAASFWGTLRDWLLLPERFTPIPAICIPPGTRLFLSDLPAKIQTSLCIGASETVTFTELPSRRYRFRDALVLPNGTRVLLQDLPEGIHAVVLCTSPEPSSEYAESVVHTA
jgi:hypothetical protein